MDGTFWADFAYVDVGAKCANLSDHALGLDSCEPRFLAVWLGWKDLASAVVLAEFCGIVIQLVLTYETPV
jgi:prepilin signal peptidase PulO-like enzyme (type II secretory pathway)